MKTPAIIIEEEKLSWFVLSLTNESKNENIREYTFFNAYKNIYYYYQETINWKFIKKAYLYE
jgi:hypothetical protein